MSTWWIAIAAIAATAQAVVVIVAAGYALAQVRESERSRKLSTLVEISARFNTDSAREDRRRIHNEFPADLTERLTPEQYATIYRTVESFTFVGDLVAQGLLSFSLIAETHARPISRNWQRLKPWVLKQRDRDPLFCASFERLGGQCRKWDAKEHGEDGVAVPYLHGTDEFR